MGWNEKYKAQYKYRQSHKAQYNAYQREWRKRNREHYLALTRNSRAKRPEAVKEANRKWRMSEKGIAWRTAWNEKNKEKVREISRKGELVRTWRKMTDSSYYARRRASVRLNKAMKRVTQGKRYRPNFSTRKPDWTVMGGAELDTHSQWLLVNRSASAKAWALERAKEIWEWRNR